MQLSKRLNFQYLFSYLGILPFIFIIIDKFLFYQVKEEISINFSIYYTLFILVFIGSINWNLDASIKNHIVIYGFLPSLFAVLILILNLYNIDITFLIISIIFFLILQLITDYIIIYSKKINKNAFFLLRMPLTSLIIISLIIIIN
tara:strand:+ start:251 stop:688 length:438 start_codon:yes stop_codon:yes gene_type:complete